MPFTTVAYYESQTATALANMAALADQHVTVAGDDIYVPELTKLMGYHFLGVDLTQARIDSPSLRGSMMIDVEGFDYLAEPASPPNWHDLFENPVSLVRSEALRAQMIEGTGPSAAWAIYWLGSGPITKAKGEIRTVRATSATTQVALNWTNCPLTFDQTLPSGEYAIVGLRGQSATAIACRLVIPGYQWRPGTIACDADADISTPRHRQGNAGIMGTFHHNEPPSVEFAAIAADAAQVVHLDLIKVS